MQLMESFRATTPPPSLFKQNDPRGPMWGRMHFQTFFQSATPWYSSALMLIPEEDHSDTLHKLVLACFTPSDEWPEGLRFTPPDGGPEGLRFTPPDGGPEGLRFMFCYSKGTANTLEREVYQTSTLGFEPKTPKAEVRS